MPTYDQLVWPTLEAVRELGGSGTLNEIDDKVRELLELPESIAEMPHGKTNRTELQYRLAWARTHLKMIDALENSRRGVWSTNPTASDLVSEDQVIRLVKEARDELRTHSSVTIENESQDDTEDSLDWKDLLLNTLKEMSPEAFERLCKRLLREAGFIDVEVTGRGSDGGIDGNGILRINLLSFHVSFQCKRYRDSVGAPIVRDFRGASVGRSDKGLILTTGRFTADARAEATRDGASPIDLIDGDLLCDLLAKYALGVEMEMVPTYNVKPAFFDKI